MRHSVEAAFPPVAVSSISATPAEEKRPWRTVWATRHTANNAVTIVHDLGEAFDTKDASIMLVPGRNINPRRFARRMRRAGVSVSSIDVPDVVPFGQMVSKIRKSLGNEDGRIKNHIGWYLTNVGSERKQQRNLRKALAATDGDMVKMGASLWREEANGRGERILTLLEKYAKKKNKTLRIAIEIDTEKQTPDGYYNMVQKLQGEKRQGLSIVYDVDLGHITQTGGKAKDFLDRVKEESIAIVSLNQHIPGEAEAHATLHDAGGAVPLAGAAERMGRNGIDAIVLFELHPTEKGYFGTKVGKGLAQHLKKAFQSGRSQAT